jgi:hypothetical protein
MKVESSNGVNPVELRFYLTNFEFEPIKLNWQLDKHDVTINRIKNYNETLNILRAADAMDITAKMSIKSLESVEIFDINRIENLANDICYLLSLAKGNKVQWLYWEAFSLDGKILRVHHRTTWITPYRANSYLIPNYAPENKKQLMLDFMNQTFDKFRQVKTEGMWKLNEAIDHFVAAKTSGSVWELQALQLVVLIEFLNGRYFSFNSSEHLIKQTKFSKTLKKSCSKWKIKSSLRDVFDLDEKESILNEMMEKTPELNRRTFKSQIQEIIQYLHIKVDEVQLTRFIKIRNSLVHKARFLGADEEQAHKKRQNIESDYQQLGTVTEIAGLMMLGVLNYSEYVRQW